MRGTEQEGVEGFSRSQIMLTQVGSLDFIPSGMGNHHRGFKWGMR